MKTILQITARITVLAIGLAAAGTAMAQTAPAPTPAANAAPAQAAPVGEDWNAFSRSTIKVYMTDVNGFVRSGDATRVRVARVALDAPAGDYSYAVDEVEVRCAAKQSRTVSSTEYGPDGVQTDRYEEPEEWAPYTAESRDAYLSQIVCEDARAEPSWPSIKAFIDAGRH
jgi:hypothetical protein